jgi:hypothetical protein
MGNSEKQILYREPIVERLVWSGDTEFDHEHTELQVPMHLTMEKRDKEHWSELIRNRDVDLKLVHTKLVVEEGTVFSGVEHVE